MRLPKVHHCRIAGKPGFCVYWSREGHQYRMQVPIEDEGLIREYCEREERAIAIEILGLEPKVPAGRLSVQEVVDRYFKDEMYVPNRAENTVQDRSDRLKKMMAHFGPRSPIASVNAESIAAWKRRRLQEAAATTVNNDLRALRALLRYARDAGLVDAIPPISLPPSKSHRGEVIPTEHVVAILRGLDLDDAHERGYYVALMTGLRGRDIAALAPEHFDPKAHSITIVTAKRGRKVVLPLPAEVWSRLERYMGERPFCRYPACDRAKNLTYRLCGARYGARICRPTWASGLAAGGADFMVIKALMGHRISDVTEGYIFRDAERLREQYALLPWLREKYLRVITGGA